MSGPFDQSPLDKATLDRTPVDTSASAITTDTEQNPRFQFSRELKILIGVLALGAAVAGWYFLSGAGTSPDTATATVPPATVTPVQNGAGQNGTAQNGQGQPGSGQTGTGQTSAVTPGTQVVPGVTAGTGNATGTQGAAGTGAAPSVTGGTSGGPVNVAQVPFLNPQGSQGQSTSVGETGTPVGINPEDPLAAVPTSNPFQPLTVVNTNAPVGTSPLQATGNTGAATNGTLAGANTPNSGRGNTLPVAGAVPLPNVPIAGISSGGANLNGNTGTGSSGVISLGNGGAVPLPSVAVGGLPSTGTGTLSGGNPATAGTGSTGIGSAGTGSAGTGLPATPAVPVQPAAGTIVPGLKTPSLSSLPLGTLTAGTGLSGSGLSGSAGLGTGASGTGTSGAGAFGTGPVGDPSALTAASIQPGLISQYGSANAPAVPAAPVVSPLDQLVQSRNLVFNAVVLGPINTAIFKTDAGFVVVPTGQNLPDSTVTLKEVTATSVTLSLGNDSKILELDKR